LRGKFLPSTMRRSAPRLIGFQPLSVVTMELFNKLFGNLPADGWGAGGRSAVKYQTI
jgi:hypothetical protein